MNILQLFPVHLAGCLDKQGYPAEIIGKHAVVAKVIPNKTIYDVILAQAELDFDAKTQRRTKRQGDSDHHTKVMLEVFRRLINQNTQATLTKTEVRTLFRTVSDAITFKDRP